MRITIRRRRAVAHRRTTSSLIGTVVLAPLAAAALVGMDPAKVGLSTTPVVLHALSFRGPMAVGLSAAGVGCLLSALPGSSQSGRSLSGRARIGRLRGRWRRLAGGSLLLAAGIGQAAVVAKRGWARPPAPGRAELTVVSLNTLGGAAAPTQIAALVAAELASADAAMVSLPETSEALAREIADLLALQGHLFQVFSATVTLSNPLSSTSMLISEQLGEYREVPAPKMLLGAVLAEPVLGTGPTFAAVHPGAPMPGVGISQWRSDVTAAVDLCRTRRISIVAGDFNACTDHQMLRHLEPCFDAATRAGRGAEGTWPAHFPPVLAAPIDHVLINGDITVLGTRTVRVGRSDHRAVIARLTGTMAPARPSPGQQGVDGGGAAQT